MDSNMIDCRPDRSDGISGINKYQAKIQKQLEEAACSESYETYESFTDPKHKMNVWMARRKGTFHKTNGTPCQDFCISRSLAGCLVLTAADGVGSCRYSDTGSKLACHAVIDAAEELLRRNRRGENRLIKDLMCPAFRGSIVSNWLKAVDRLIKTDPAYSRADITDFASTVMFAVITRHNMVTCILGDGQIMVLNQTAGLKVRMHEKKYTSEVRSLADPQCTGEDFTIQSFSRKDFDTVILTTDGLYDSLSPGSHLYRYTLEACLRFMKNKAPYQAFCYTEKGDSYKDFSRTNTQDDCTVVIAKSLTESPAKAFLSDRISIARHRNAALLKGYSRDCRVYFTRTEKSIRLPEERTTASNPSGRSYSDVAVSYTRRNRRLEKCSLVLESACLDIPSETWEYGRYTYNAYAHNEGILPLRYLLDTGMLKENRNLPDNNADKCLTLDLLTNLVLLQDELYRQGLSLNSSALINIGYEIKNKTLHVRSEAITVRKIFHNHGSDLYSSCFSHLLGVIVFNQFILPVFRPGYREKGRKIVLHLYRENASLTLMVYRQNNCFYLKNQSTCGSMDHVHTDRFDESVFLGSTAYGTGSAGERTPRTFVLSIAAGNEEDSVRRLEFIYIPLAAFDRIGEFL